MHVALHKIHQKPMGLFELMKKMGDIKRQDGMIWEGKNVYMLLQKLEKKAAQIHEY